MATIFDPDMLASTVRISTPILIAAMGGLICMRAAVFNIGLEGFMLIGAFFAIYVAEMVGSVVAGWLGGYDRRYDFEFDLWTCRYPV